MALSSGPLVTSTISLRAGKGDPDCSKTKLAVRLRPSGIFSRILFISVRLRDWLMGKKGFLRVKFKISDEQPRPFDIGVPPE